jgi:hypothetical protein
MKLKSEELKKLVMEIKIGMQRQRQRQRQGI